MPSAPAKTILPLVRSGTTGTAAVTAAAAELFDVSPSGKEDETVAVLLITVSATVVGSSVATIEALTVAPTASDGKVTVRLFPAPPHVPPGASHETKVSPAGSTSLKVTELAAAPDLFVTVNRKTAFAPGATLLMRADFVTARSAKSTVVWA